MRPIDPLLPPVPPPSAAPPRLSPEAAAALLVHAPEEPPWSAALMRAFSVFLVGAALGFGVCALLSPMDLATAAEQPGRPGLMELWVKFGLPIVGLLSIAHAARARNDRPGTVLVANALMVMASLGLVWKFYPGTRAQAAAASAARAERFEVDNYALLASGPDLARNIARFRSPDLLDDFLETLARRNPVLKQKSPLPPEAVDALRSVAAEGRPRTCSACLALIRARVLLEDGAPGTLGSTLALCPDGPCREQLAGLVVAGSTRFCVESLGRGIVLDTDLAPLRRIAQGQDDGIGPEMRAAVASWVQRHPSGECPQPRPRGA